MIDKPFYNKAYPPRKEKEDPLDVKVDIILYDIQNVKELDMSFSSELTLDLEWSDERVTFSNLKPGKGRENILGYEVAKDIWIPPLVFNNTRQNKVVGLDETAVLKVRRRGSPKLDKRSSIHGDHFYMGSDNSLIYEIGYEMTFSCVYHLSRYPFDTQICLIEVICFVVAMNNRVIQIFHVNNNFSHFPYFRDSGTGSRGNGSFYQSVCWWTYL